MSGWYDRGILEVGREASGWNHYSYSPDLPDYEVTLPPGSEWRGAYARDGRLRLLKTYAGEEMAHNTLWYPTGHIRYGWIAYQYDWASEETFGSFTPGSRRYEQNTSYCWIEGPYDMEICDDHYSSMEWFCPE
ncbi:MAG: hypothetical protein JXX28_03245 [Deltaproteobacteria bacterium]|nr:hypothetical protein [Deltaproteobacteria bacterium]